MNNYNNNCGSCNKPAHTSSCPPIKPSCPPKAIPVSNCADCDGGDLDTNIMSGSLGDLAIKDEDGLGSRYTGIPLIATNWLGRELGVKGNPDIQDKMSWVGGIIKEEESFTSQLDGSEKAVEKFYQLSYQMVLTPDLGGWQTIIYKTQINPNLYKDISCVDGNFIYRGACKLSFVGKREILTTLKDGIHGSLLLKGTLPADVFTDFCGLISKLVTAEGLKEDNDVYDDCGKLNHALYVIGETFKSTQDKECSIGVAIDREKLLKEVLEIIRTCKGQLFEVNKTIDNCGDVKFCVNVKAGALDGLVRINTEDVTKGSGNVIASDKITKIQTLKFDPSSKKLASGCPSGTGTTTDCVTCKPTCASDLTSPFTGTLVGAFSAGTNQTFTYSNGSSNGTIKGDVTGSGTSFTIVGTITNHSGALGESTIYHLGSGIRGTATGNTTNSQAETECSTGKYSSDLRLKNCDFTFNKDADGNMVLGTGDKYIFDSKSFVITPCPDACKTHVRALPTVYKHSAVAKLVLDPITLPINGIPYPLYSFGKTLGNAEIVGNTLITDYIDFTTLVNAPSLAPDCQEWQMDWTFSGILLNGSYLFPGTITVSAELKINGATTYYLPDNAGVGVPITASASFPSGDDYPDSARQVTLSAAGNSKALTSGSKVQVRFIASFPKSISIGSSLSICFADSTRINVEYKLVQKPNCTLPPVTC